MTNSEEETGGSCGCWILLLVIGGGWYFFQDALAVNRAGKRSNILCYQYPLQPMVTPDLAFHVRDHDPNAPGPKTPWNMADLMLSSLMLDDLSPMYLAQLFGQQGTVIVPLLPGTYRVHAAVPPGVRPEPIEVEARAGERQQVNLQLR